MIKPKPLLSIVIPTFNGPVELERSLRALFKNNLDCVEVIVVNDGSDDPKTGTVISSFGVVQVTSNDNIGRGPARNLGAVHASGEYLLFLDADVEVPPNIVDRVLEIIRTNPEIEVFFGSYDDAPDCSHTISQYRNLLHHYTHKIASDYAPHFWTGFGVVKTSIFSQVGGFNQGKWARNMEEVDLGYRINEAGHRIRLFRHLQVKHLKSYNLVGMIKSDLIDRAIPWTLYIREHHTSSNDFVTSSRQRLSVISVALILLIVLFPFIGLLALALSLVGLISFVSLNLPFFRFCFEARGYKFLLSSVLLHLVHTFCAGLGYGIGNLIYVSQRIRIALISSNTGASSNGRVGSYSNEDPET